LRRTVVVVLVLTGIPLLCAGCAGSDGGAGGGVPGADRAVAASAAAGRAPATGPSAVVGGGPETVVARMGSQTITLGELEEPLIKAYGLNVLLNLVQLDLVKQAAKDAGVTVTPEDVRQEREMMVGRMFREAEKSDYEQLLDQFLAREHITRAEFDLVLETNANLRKIAEPQLRDKVTEENVQEGFRVQYGEKVLVHHVQCANQQEIAAVQRRLAAGESFEKVATELSRNQISGPIGGELPAFTRADTRFGQAFKEMAFGLKVGEISEPVEWNGSLHLIKLVQRIEPKAVKYEDVKDSVKRELVDQWTQQIVRQLRAKIGQQALAALRIENPELKRQFEEKVAKSRAAAQGQVQGRDEVKKEIERREREAAKEDAGAAGATEAGRPPATMPGAAVVAPGNPAK